MLYGKPGCHLCELVEAEVRSVVPVGTELRVVNIEEDSAAHDEYWLRIPVVIVGGVVAFEAKMMDPAGEWRKTIPGALGRSKRQGC